MHSRADANVERFNTCFFKPVYTGAIDMHLRLLSIHLYATFNLLIHLVGSKTGLSRGNDTWHNSILLSKIPNATAEVDSFKASFWIILLAPR